jgi:hypothetical protein
MTVIRPIKDETEDALLQSGALEGKAVMSGPPRVSYSRQLLEVAKRLITQGDFGIAIVVAHTACEIAVERALSQQLQSRKIDEMLEEAIEGFLSGYALTDNRARKLYAALTGDNIQQTTFWQRYEQSVGRRNRVVHRGATMEKTEAEASLQVVAEFVTHMKQ